MTQYNNALNLYEHYSIQLLSEQAIELNKINNNVDVIVNNSQTTSKLAKTKSPAVYTTLQLLPFHIHIPPITALIVFCAILTAARIFPLIIAIIHLFFCRPHRRD